MMTRSTITASERPGVRQEGWLGIYHWSMERNLTELRRLVQKQSHKGQTNEERKDECATKKDVANPQSTVT